jgi:hypothetical protein
MHPVREKSQLWVTVQQTLVCPCTARTGLPTSVLAGVRSMPKKLPTEDGKRKACVAAAATQAPAKKTCPHRTQQTPFERLDEETTYIVDKMVGMWWNKGSLQYLVRWKGYAASTDTWEPMENLVCCAQLICKYEKLQEKEDIEAKAAVLANRQEAKNAAAAVEEDLKAINAETALAGAGDGDAAAAHCADTTGSVLKTHGKKKGHIWSAYDLTGEKQSCLLMMMIFYCSFRNKI